MGTRVIGYRWSMVHSIKLLAMYTPFSRKQSGNLNFILFTEVANGIILSYCYRTTDNSYQKGVVNHSINKIHMNYQL